MSDSAPQLEDPFGDAVRQRLVGMKGVFAGAARFVLLILGVLALYVAIASGLWQGGGGAWSLVAAWNNPAPWLVAAICFHGLAIGRGPSA